MRLVGTTYSEECAFFLSVCPETGLLEAFSSRCGSVVPWVSDRTS